MERLKDKEMPSSDPEDDDSLWENDQIEELISDIMHKYDQYGLGAYLPDDLSERLERVDPDYYEWFYDLGKLPHPRVILWWQALKLARNQVMGRT